MTVDKGSELAGFVSIPLHLAQTLINLPAQIVQLKINVATNQAELYQQQAALVDANNKYIQQLLQGATLPGARDS